MTDARQKADEAWENYAQFSHARRLRSAVQAEITAHLEASIKDPESPLGYLYAMRDEDLQAEHEVASEPDPAPEDEVRLPGAVGKVNSAHMTDNGWTPRNVQWLTEVRANDRLYSASTVRRLVEERDEAEKRHRLHYNRAVEAKIKLNAQLMDARRKITRLRAELASRPKVRQVGWTSMGEVKSAQRGHTGRFWYIPSKSASMKVYVPAEEEESDV
jgi:hypothetical protein